MKKLLLALFSLTLSLAVLEAAFRLLRVPIDAGRTRYFGLVEAVELSPHPLHPGHDRRGLLWSFYRYRPGSTWWTRYPSDPRHRFDAEGRVAYRMNADGFRDREFAPLRPEAYRILAIGDSFTLGEGVLAEETFAKVLEVLLRERRPEVEVLNLGVNGYDTSDELVELDSALECYRPDLVVWGFVLNDISRQETARWSVAMATARLRVTLRTHSRFLDWAQARVGNAWQSRQYVRFVNDLYESPAYWPRLAGGLLAAERRVAAAGAVMVVVVFPDLDGLRFGGDPFASIHARLTDFLAGHGLRFVDLAPTYRAHPGVELRVHPVDAHPNEEAHRLAAEVLAERVSELWN